VSGYSNGEQVALVIDPTDTNKKQVFTGTIDTSGVQVTNVVWTEGTNQAHSAGATVVDYTTATHQAALAKGLKVSLSDDGMLKSKVVTLSNIDGGSTAGLFHTDTSGEATASKVVNADLSTTAGELGGAWTSWTPTLSGRLNDAKWTKSCRYTRIGKTVFCNFRIAANSATPMDGGTADAFFTLPATAIALTGAAIGTQQIGSLSLFDNNTAVYQGVIFMSSTTVGLIRFADDAAGGVGISNAITSTAPFTWANTDEIAGIFIYEAA
jgi:hypothetical protein